jgi:hypothetical protein
MARFVVSWPVVQEACRRANPLSGHGSLLVDVPGCTWWKSSVASGR